MPLNRYAAEILRHASNCLGKRKFALVESGHLPQDAENFTVNIPDQLQASPKEIAAKLCEAIPTRATRCYKLALPPGVEAVYSLHDPINGLCLRVVRSYDVIEHRICVRLDACFS